MIQRFFDILFSAIGLTLFLPFFVPIAAILCCTGEGEIFYTQERIGYGGRPFRILKFATMLKASEMMGARDITLKNDPRVLPFGKFLRKTKLNELPQLFNVLKGDMSLVGPRPMSPKLYQYYSHSAQEKLNTIRPGLTGVGSIIFRDEESYLENADGSLSFYKTILIPYKTDLELWYIEHQSILLYLTILFLTAWALVFPNTKSMQTLFPNLPTAPDILMCHKF